MRITLQVVQSHSQEATPCLVFSVENQKYFFNIPDSFQRYFKEHSVRINKGAKIFLTQLASDHLCGLFGLVLTLNAQGLAEDNQIFGPPGLANYLDSVRFLIGHRVIPFSIYDFFNNHQKLVGVKSQPFLHEIFNSKDYNSIFFQMNDYLLQQQKTRPEVINDAQSFITEQGVYKDENVEIHPILLTGSETSPRPSVCYILKPKKIPGKVNSDKLKQHNIKPKYIKLLLESEEAEIEGTVYKSKDFRDPDSPSPVVVLIDCPSLAHLNSLLLNEKIQSLYSEKIDLNEVNIKAIVHIASSEVLVNSQYSTFLKSFPESCQHIFMNEEIKSKKIEVSPEKKEKAGKSKGKKEETKEEKEEKEGGQQPAEYRHFLFTNILAKYFPDHFPTLKDIQLLSKYDLNELYPFLNNKSTPTKQVELVLAPVKNEGFSLVPSSAEKVSKFVNFVETEKFLKKYKKWISLLDSLKQSPVQVPNLFKNCDPELVFLGTQSMMPSLYCNVSGIYLRFWQQNNIGIVLDCGEGTYIQLLHHYGLEKTKEFVKTLKVIYITHIHADHHLGLLQLIRERDRVRKEANLPDDPVYLVLPFNCGAWVHKFNKFVEKLNYVVIFCQHLKIEGSKDDSVLDTHEAKTGVLLQERKDKTEEEEKMEIEKGNMLNDVEFEHYEDPEMDKYLLETEKESIQYVPSFKKFLEESLGIVKFNAVDVEHCPQAYGVYIEHKDGWKFAYSGDTRPSDLFVEEIKNTTILVHEATFGEELQDHAIFKMHSTDKEAIQVGMRLKAWRTILTHFSQRYGIAEGGAAKEKVKDELYNYSKSSVVRAYDHFGAKFSQLEHMPLVSSCLSRMFNDE